LPSFTVAISTIICLCFVSTLIQSFFLTTPPHLRSTLFPYTTLFRSERIEWRTIAVRDNKLRAEERDDISHVDMPPIGAQGQTLEDRKSTRLNSSHQIISYAVFCLKKKNINTVSMRIFTPEFITQFRY